MLKNLVSMLTDIYLSLGAYSMEYACHKTILKELGYMLYLNGEYTESINITLDPFVSACNALYLAKNSKELDNTVQIFLDNNYDLFEAILYFFNRKDYGKMFEMACKSKDYNHKGYIGIYYLMYDLPNLARDYIFNCNYSACISFNLKFHYYDKIIDINGMEGLLSEGIKSHNQQAIDIFIENNLPDYSDLAVIQYYNIFTTISDNYFYRYNPQFMNIFINRNIPLTNIVEKTIEMMDGNALLVYATHLYEHHAIDFVKYAWLSLLYGNLNATIIIGIWCAIHKDFTMAITYFKKGIKMTNVQMSYEMLLDAYVEVDDYENWTYTVIDYYEKYNDKYLSDNNIEMDTKIKNFQLFPFYKATTKVYKLFECPIDLKDYTEGYKLRCGHVFSKQIFMIRDNACPLCRQAICD